MRIAKKHKYPSSVGDNRGFTLIELSVVLVIAAFVVGGALTLGLAALERRPYEETIQKMRAIEKNLQAYRISYGRIPCPADFTRAITAATFAVEATTPGVCTPTAGIFTDGGNLVVGMVPVRTLQLPDSYAFDGWGRRFTLMLDRRATGVHATSGRGAFEDFPITSTSIGLLEVRDITDNSRTANGIYALISHGKNGHGGFNYNGSARINASAIGGAPSARELENCDCDTAAVATAANNVVYQQSVTENSVTVGNNFDDIVLYKTRKSMRAPYE